MKAENSYKRKERMQGKIHVQTWFTGINSNEQKREKGAEKNKQTENLLKMHRKNFKPSNENYCKMKSKIKLEVNNSLRSKNSAHLRPGR